MNHTKIVKYIKSKFKNIVNDKIKYYERHICNSIDKSIKNQYSLKNPTLCEHCLIDSLKELNSQLSAESKKCIKHLEESFSYRLSIQNNYLKEKIHIYDTLNILPNRIKKINEDEDNLHISNNINIIDIKLIDRYG